MASKNSINVAIKVRKEKDQPNFWRVVNNSIQLFDSQGEPYYFDHIFDQDANNQLIFDKMAKHIVHAAIQGFNGTIFAYGQTSSGKTYTMIGDENDPGVMVLAAKEIFKEIERNKDRQFLLRVGYIEIYNEKIYDLLNKTNQDLKIHETPTGIVSVNCQENIVTCEEDLLHHLCMGNKERTVGETNMNERSSRSHAIFRIILESRKLDRPEEDDAIIQSVLNLVDLAGSERADQTGARGARLKEGGHINKSLLFLSNVIKRLSEEEDNKYISYRDSKLTRILQASLGGNALTSIICTIKPTTVEETQSTLSFATRAKTVKNKPQVNEIVSDATMMKRLEREIRDLKSRLAEERRKNESQFKVGQLEQRINYEVVKIITGDSLHNIRAKREKRRRTWCPETANPDVVQSALPIPTTDSLAPSRLQLPRPKFNFTPHITLREPAADTGPKQQMLSMPTDDVLKEDEENFKSGELFAFDQFTEEKKSPNSEWDQCKTPVRLEDKRTLSLTPKLSTEASLQMLETALLELREFTNLEQKIDVKHDVYEALKQKVEALSSRNAVLEQERLNHIQIKDELVLTKKNLDDCEKRCGDSQVEIGKLTLSNQDANDKISKYEEQLKELKATISLLETENREVVSLEFEFQSHKTKSKLREAELIEALAEKDREICKLKKSLDSLSRGKLDHSKELLMQLSHTDAADQTSGQVCVKCEDLQRLLDENQKVILEFEKLKLEHEQLQLCYAQSTTNATNAQSELTELKATQLRDASECEKLRGEIACMREALERLQHDYEQLNCDRNAKSETCEELNRLLNTAREDMLVLQEKYENMEGMWKKQQKSIGDIQRLYDAIQERYESLQVEYEKLEHTSTKSLGDCVRLRQENDVLQAEISNLRTLVEDAQKKLVEIEVTSKSTPEATENVDELKRHNAKLREEMSEMQLRFDNLQKEYDDLSNQLMDSLQEGETLKVQYEKLQAETKMKESEQESEIAALGVQKEAELDALRSEFERELAHLKSQLQMAQGENATKCVKNRSSIVDSMLSESMRSSGVYIERDARDRSEGEGECECDSSRVNGDGNGNGNGVDDCLAKFVEMTEFLHEIELEYTTGKSRIFRAMRSVDDQLSPEENTRRRLLLRNIEEITALHDEQNWNATMKFDEDTGKVLCMQGVLKRHSFHIMELEGDENDVSATKSWNEEKDTLKQKVENLISDNQYLKDLLAATEGTIGELREQINILSAELLEKSQVIEKCACENYQKHIEELERTLSERTMMMTGTEELELNGLSVSKRSESVETICMQKVKADVEEKSEKSENAEKSEASPQLEYNQQLEDAQATIETLRKQLECKEKELKNECNRLQLELMEKLEFNESEFRENIRKYNQEWEQSKEAYESETTHLRQQLEALKAENVRICDECDDLRQNLEQTKTDLQQHSEQLKTLEDEKRKLEDSKLEVEKKLSENEEKLTAINEEMQSVRNLLETEQSELSKLRAEKTLLCEELGELKDSHEKLLEEKMREKSLLETGHAELNRLQAEKTLLCEELEKMKDSHEKLLEEKMREKSRLETEQSELSKLQAQKSSLCEELEKLRDSHEKVLEEAMQEKSRLCEEQRALEDKVKISTEQKIKIECDFLVLKEENESLNLKLESLKSVQVELEELQKKFSQALSEKEKVGKEIHEVQEQHSSREVVIKALEKQVEELESLLEKEKNTGKSIEALKCEYENVLQAVRQERDNLKLAFDQQRQEKLAVEEKAETFQLKIEDFEQKLHETKVQATRYEKLVVDFEELERSLAAANEEKTNLAKRVATLESVEAQMQKLHTEMSREKSKLDNEKKDLENSLVELQIKCDSLKVANEQLLQTNSSLQTKLEAVNEKASEFENLQTELKELKAKRDELKRQMETSLAEARRCSESLRQDVAHHQSQLKEKTEEIARLRMQLASKEAAFKKDKQKLEGTISCLLLEKKTFEEKLYLTETALKKMESELQSANNSMDSNNSGSPRARKSIERVMGESKQLKPINTNLEEKLNAERRNKRLSTHDERRRQSFWGVNRDVGTMTIPSDTNCSCAELDKKLKECERNLFIRESQVTALNLELKNHPLKAENAALKKRLQEEQDKNRIEIKRFKQMIADQTAKMKSAKDAAVAAAAAAAAAATVANEEAIKLPSKVVADVNTQTESDLELCLQKSQSKVNDLTNICRYRYKLIKELEEKIAQKENTNENVPISALEAGQIKSLKSQCETLNKELQKYKQKYDDAKKVLHLRRMEIDRLKGLLGGNDCEEVRT